MIPSDYTIFSSQKLLTAKPFNNTHKQSLHFGYNHSDSFSLNLTVPPKHLNHPLLFGVRGARSSSVSSRTTPTEKPRDLPEYIESIPQENVVLPDSLRQLHDSGIKQIQKIWSQPFNGHVAVINGFPYSGLDLSQLMATLAGHHFNGKVNLSKLAGNAEGPPAPLALSLQKCLEQIKQSEKYIYTSPQHPGIICLNNLPTHQIDELEDFSNEKYASLNELVNDIAPNLRLLLLPKGLREQTFQPFNLSTQGNKLNSVTFAQPTPSQWAATLYQDPLFKKISGSKGHSITEDELAQFIREHQSLYSQGKKIPLTKKQLLTSYQDWASQPTVQSASQYFKQLAQSNLPPYIRIHQAPTSIPERFLTHYADLASKLSNRFTLPLEHRTPLVTIDPSIQEEMLNDDQHFEKLCNVLAAKPGNTIASLDFAHKALRKIAPKEQVKQLLSDAQLLQTSNPQQNITLHLKNLDELLLSNLLRKPKTLEQLKEVAPNVQLLIQPKAVPESIWTKHQNEIQTYSAPKLNIPALQSILMEDPAFQNLLQKHHLTIAPDTLEKFIKLLKARLGVNTITEKALKEHFTQLCQEFTQAGIPTNHTQSITSTDVENYIHSRFIKPGPISKLPVWNPSQGVKPEDKSEIQAWQKEYDEVAKLLVNTLQSPLEPLIQLQTPWEEQPPHLKSALYQSIESSGIGKVFSVNLNSAIKELPHSNDDSTYDSDDSHLMSSSHSSPLANLLIDVAQGLKRKHHLNGEKIILNLENHPPLSMMDSAFYETLAKKAPELKLIVPIPRTYEPLALEIEALYKRHTTDFELPSVTAKQWAKVLPHVPAYQKILNSHGLHISQPDLERLLNRIQRWDAYQHDHFDLSLTKESILSHLLKLCKFVTQNPNSSVKTITQKEIDAYRKDEVQKYKRIYGTTPQQAHASYQVLEPEDLPDISLNQVIGLSTDTRQLLQDVIDSFNGTFSELDEALVPHGGNDNLFQKGILLYGVPGTGKTMAAKALAKSCPGDVTFIHATGSSMFGLKQYIGQSVKNVEKFFSELKKISSPAVVFIDEFDIGERHSSSGKNAVAQQEMNNVINTVLANVQGMGTQNEGPARLFIFATNRPLSGIDSAIVRRIGNKAEVTLPNVANQTEILKRELNKWHLSFDNELFGPDKITVKQLLTKTKDSDKLSGSDIANMAANLQKKIRQSKTRTELAKLSAELGQLKTPEEKHLYLQQHFKVTPDLLKEALVKAIDTKISESIIKVTDSEIVKDARRKMAQEQANMQAYMEMAETTSDPEKHNFYG